MTDEVREMVAYQGEESQIQAYLVKPALEGPRPAIILIHEILGLNDQIKGIAHRFAAEGYVVFAPDLFSRPELAPVLIPAKIEEVMEFVETLDWRKMSDREYMQQAISQQPEGKRETIQRTLPVLFGGVSKEKATQDLVKALDYLKQQSFIQADKIGSVGFCFGGGMSINFACHAPLAASIVFYGDNPNPIELVKKIPCPVLGIYGANDLRINSHLHELVGAMVQYKKDFEMRIYPNAGHAFFNEEHPHVYNEAATRESWDQVLRFYKRTLLEA